MKNDEPTQASNKKPYWTFGFDSDQAELVEEFVKKYSQPGVLHGTIGGAFTYSFTPTTLGIVAKVTHASGKELDVTDYESW